MDEVGLDHATSPDILTARDLRRVSAPEIFHIGSVDERPPLTLLVRRLGARARDGYWRRFTYHCAKCGTGTFIKKLSDHLKQSTGTISWTALSLGVPSKRWTNETLGTFRLKTAY